MCLEKGIEKVCYDRGGHVYHGRIQVCALLYQLHLLLAIAGPRTALCEVFGGSCGVVLKPGDNIDVCSRRLWQKQLEKVAFRFEAAFM